jgi:Spy/CpxP family protein refolding chaperone
MKSLKISLLIAALAVTMCALAQDSGQQGGPGGPGGMHGGRGPGRQMPSVDDQVTELTKSLKLSDDQQKQVHTILQNQHDQMQQLFQDQSLSREERHSKMKDLHQSTNTKINGVLNDDQKKKYEEMQQKRRQEMQEHMGGQGPGNQ